MAVQLAATAPIKAGPLRQTGRKWILGPNRPLRDRLLKNRVQFVLKDATYKAGVQRIRKAPKNLASLEADLRSRNLPKDTHQTINLSQTR